jgi:hypothetical protein
MKTKISAVTTKGQLQVLTPVLMRTLRGCLKGTPSALKLLLERQRDREL